MSKLLFFDVDGTLYNSQKKLPQSAKEAIAQARENGHKIAIATGRAPFMIESLLKELNIKTYICFNGQYVVYEGETIFTDGIPNEELKDIIAFSGKRGEPVVFIDDKEMVASIPGHSHIEESLATLKVPYPRVDESFYEIKQVYQTLIFMTEEDEHLYKEKFPNVQFIRWHPFCCDILPKKGSKLRGINKILTHLGCSMDDVIAFGDGLNDIEMLQGVGTGVAMGNSHKEVLAVADVIAPHVDDDGLANIMKKLHLI